MKRMGVQEKQMYTMELLTGQEKKVRIKFMLIQLDPDMREEIIL